MVKVEKSVLIDAINKLDGDYVDLNGINSVLGGMFNVDYKNRIVRNRHETDVFREIENRKSANTEDFSSHLNSAPEYNKYNGFYLYYMYDKFDNLLYMGRTNNIINRMFVHFAPTTICYEKWKNDVALIKYEVYEDYFETEVLEEYYIQELNPKYNNTLLEVKRQYISEDIKEIKILDKNHITVFSFMDNIKFKFNDSKFNKKIKIDFKKINSKLIDFINHIEREEFSIDDFLEYLGVPDEDLVKHINRYFKKNKTPMIICLLYGYEYCDGFKKYKITKLNQEKSSKKSIFLDSINSLKEEKVKITRITNFKKKYEMTTYLFANGVSKYKSTVNSMNIFKINNYIVNINEISIDEVLENTNMFKDYYHK